MSDPSHPPAVDLAGMWKLIERCEKYKYQTTEISIDKLVCMAAELTSAREREANIEAGTRELRRYVEGNGFQWQESESTVFNVTTALGLMGGQIEAARERIVGLERENGEFERAYGREFDRATMLIETVAELRAELDRLREVCELAKDELTHATWAKGADQSGLKYAIDKCTAALSEPKPEGGV